MLAVSLFICVLVLCASTSQAAAEKESNSVMSNVLEFFNPSGSASSAETKGADKDKNKMLRGELRPRVAPVILDAEDTVGKKKAGLITKKPSVIVDTEETEVKLVKPAKKAKKVDEEEEEEPVVKKPSVIVDTEETEVKLVKPAKKAKKVVEEEEEEPVVKKTVKKAVAKEEEEEEVKPAKKAKKVVEEEEEEPVVKKTVKKAVAKEEEEEEVKPAKKAAKNVVEEEIEVKAVARKVVRKVKATMSEDDMNKASAAAEAPKKAPSP